jgi:hypothetical protein
MEVGSGTSAPRRPSVALIYFDCPHCGVRLSSGDNTIGQIVPCGSCQGQVIVPALPLIPAPSVAEDDQVAGLAALFALLGPAILLATGGAFLGKSMGKPMLWVGAVVGMLVGAGITWKWGETLANLGYWLLCLAGLVFLAVVVFQVAIKFAT